MKKIEAIEDTFRDAVKPPKRSRTKQALRNIKASLWKTLNSMPFSQLIVLGKPEKVKNLLQDPILKMLAAKHPAHVLSFKVEEMFDKDEHFYDIDKSKEVLINEFTKLVVKHYQDEVTKVRRAAKVTFRVQSAVNPKQSLVFDQLEQPQAHKHLQASYSEKDFG